MNIVWWRPAGRETSGRPLASKPPGTLIALRSGPGGLAGNERAGLAGCGPDERQSGLLRGIGRTALCLPHVHQWEKVVSRAGKLGLCK